MERKKYTGKKTQEKSKSKPGKHYRVQAVHNSRNTCDNFLYCKHCSSVFWFGFVVLSVQLLLGC